MHAEQQLPKAWSQVMRPRGISPSKAMEDPGLPEVPDSKEGSEKASQRRLWQIFSSSSGPWEVCSGPDAGRDAVKAGKGLFSQYLHRCGFQRCTVRATELGAGWEPLSRSSAGAQELVVTPLHQFMLPSQLWGSNRCTMGSSPITVASVLLMGSGALNLLYHSCIPKYTSLCSYWKLHLSFHRVNFQCFVSRNYSRVFQELERSTRLCIALWLRLGNNLTDLDLVNMRNLFFAQNKFILKFNIGLVGLIENSVAFSWSTHLALTMHVVVGSGHKIGVHGEKTTFSILISRAICRHSPYLTK